MKGKTIAIAAVAAVTVLGATAFIAGPVSAHGPGWKWSNASQGQVGGPGMMGYGQGRMGGGYGMRGQGPGAMGWGRGPGAGSGGPCWQGQAALEKELTTADVTTLVERHLAIQGNDRLKVGPVTEKGDDTIVADVVTKDGSLVWRFEFDRSTGRMTPAN